MGGPVCQQAFQDQIEFLYGMNDMKAGELVDMAIQFAERPIVIQMPNGHQVTTTGFRVGDDKRGDPVLVIHAGKPKPQ